MKLTIISKSLYFRAIETAKKAIEITETEYAGLKNGTYKIADDLMSVIKISEQEKAAEVQKERIEELKQKLAKTDNISLACIDGSISEQDYEPIKEQRQAIRDEINALAAEIIKLGGETYDVLSIL